MITLVAEQCFLGLVEGFGDVFSFFRSLSFELVNGG